MTNSLIANDQKLENDNGIMSITRKLKRQKQKKENTEKDNVIWYTTLAPLWTALLKRNKQLDLITTGRIGLGS